MNIPIITNDIYHKWNDLSEISSIGQSFDDDTTDVDNLLLQSWKTILSLWNDVDNYIFPNFEFHLSFLDIDFKKYKILDTKVKDLYYNHIWDNIIEFLKDFVLERNIAVEEKNIYEFINFIIESERYNKYVDKIITHIKVFHNVENISTQVKNLY